MTSASTCLEANFACKPLPERLIKQSLADTRALGIEDASGHPMKTSKPVSRSGNEDSGNSTTGSGDRPLRICVVFDEDASARNAEVLIRHVAADYQCDTQSFRFDELDAPAPGVAAARGAAETDIFMLAVRGDRMLPVYVRLWLGLCLGLRDKGREGALVALITNTAGTTDLHPSLVDYLETIAALGGLAFFQRQYGVPHTSSSDSEPTGSTATAPARFERFCFAYPHVDRFAL
jgi:hypothetical protein